MTTRENRVNESTDEICREFSERFSLDDSSQCSKDLRQELDRLRDELVDPRKHSLMEQIDQWERESIETIRKTADECREKWINYCHGIRDEMEKKLNELSQQIKQVRDENQFDQADLNNIKEKLQKLKGELVRSSNVHLRQQATSFINKISLSMSYPQGSNEIVQSNYFN